MRPSRSSFFATQSLQATPPRRRAQGLAEEWRAVDAAVRLLEERVRVRAALAGGRSHVIVLRDPADTIPASAQRLVESALDSVWREWGLKDTKVRVGIVVELGRPPAAASQPLAEQFQFSYLEPDSSDRTTCVALLYTAPYWRRILSGERPPSQVPDRLTQWLRAGVGPCAFYARFGAPGKPVRRWLAARSWDVASLLTLRAPESSRSVLGFVDNAASPWFWDQVYSFPSATVACLAGRETGCRGAVLMGADVGEAGAPSVVRTDRRWWRAQRLVPAGRYLSDVARAVGRDRFQQFWTSSLPIDTALAAALKQPIGEWTARWEAGFIPPIRLGPAPAIGAAGLAFLLALVAVGAVAAGASRRQVR